MEKLIEVKRTPYDVGPAYAGTCGSQCGGGPGCNGGGGGAPCSGGK